MSRAEDPWTACARVPLNESLSMALLIASRVEGLSTACAKANRDGDLSMAETRTGQGGDASLSPANAIPGPGVPMAWVGEEQGSGVWAATAPNGVSILGGLNGDGLAPGRAPIQYGPGWGASAPGDGLTQSGFLNHHGVPSCRGPDGVALARGGVPSHHGPPNRVPNHHGVPNQSGVLSQGGVPTRDGLGGCVSAPAGLPSQGCGRNRDWFGSGSGLAPPDLNRDWSGSEPSLEPVDLNQDWSGRDSGLAPAGLPIQKLAVWLGDLLIQAGGVLATQGETELASATKTALAHFSSQGRDWAGFLSQGRDWVSLRPARGYGVAPFWFDRRPG